MIIKASYANRSSFIALSQDFAKTATGLTNLTKTFSGVHIFYQDCDTANDKLKIQSLKPLCRSLLNRVRSLEGV